MDQAIENYHRALEALDAAKAENAEAQKIPERRGEPDPRVRLRKLTAKRAVTEAEHGVANARFELDAAIGDVAGLRLAAADDVETVDAEISELEEKLVDARRRRAQRLGQLKSDYAALFDQREAEGLPAPITRLDFDRVDASGRRVNRSTVECLRSEPESPKLKIEHSLNAEIREWSDRVVELERRERERAAEAEREERRERQAAEARERQRTEARERQAAVQAEEQARRDANETIARASSRGLDTGPALEALDKGDIRAARRAAEALRERL